MRAAMLTSTSVVSNQLALIHEGQLLVVSANKAQMWCGMTPHMGKCLATTWTYNKDDRRETY